MTERIGIFGRSGSGKTSAFYHAVRGAPRVLMADPLAQVRRERWPGWRSTADRRAVLRWIADDPARYRIAFEARPGREPEDVDWLCRQAVKLQRGFPKHGERLVVAVDELNLSFPVNGGATLCPGFAELCSRGRHHGVELMGVSQRLAEVSTRFRGNLSVVLILQQMGAADTRAAAELIGADLDTIRALEKFDVLAWSDGKTEKTRTRPIP